ncbi:hypothetical protein D3C84_952240 [compost metagenome]
MQPVVNLAAVIEASRGALDEDETVMPEEGLQCPAHRAACALAAVYADAFGDDSALHVLAPGGVPLVYR